jgi:hypothetical protein
MEAHGEESGGVVVLLLHRRQRKRAEQQVEDGTPLEGTDWDKHCGGGELTRVHLRRP